MTEEALAQETSTKTDEVLAANGVSPKETITKTAETKLKEMSRKAKERGKSNTPKPRSEPVIKLNQNWLLGGLGISAILAIGYFIYKSRGSISEPPPELQPYHHIPKEQASATARGIEATRKRSLTRSLKTRLT